MSKLQNIVENGTAEFTRNRPGMNKDIACDLVKKLYGFDVTFVEEFNSYLDRNYHVKVSPVHVNPHVTSVSDDGYILKVLHQQPEKYVEAQHAMQAALNRQGTLCPVPVLSLLGQDMTQMKLPQLTSTHNNNEGDVSGVHIVRLLEYIPGRMLCDVPYTPRLLYQVGQLVANIDKCFEGFHHEGLEFEETFGNLWRLENFPNMKKYFFAVTDEDNKRLVTDVLEAFQRDVMTKYDSFSKGVTHGDCSDQNILVAAQDNISGTSLEYRPHAILDFGCVAYSCYIFEVAISTMYIMTANKTLDVLETGGHILSGYLSVRSLNDDELDVFYLCVAARYCQSLVFSEYNRLREPDNEYIQLTAKRGWKQLKMLMSANHNELKSRWRKNILS